MGCSQCLAIRLKFLELKKAEKVKVPDGKSDPPIKKKLKKAEKVKFPAGKPAIKPKKK